MQYMLLIYSAEEAWQTMSPEDSQRMQSDFDAFTAALRESGSLVTADRLQPADTATTIRVRDGQTLTTDGPFAETKEQLGGYYVVEAETLDDALAWAARVPSARVGSIEVRPVWC